jgi:hypothetical protein
MRIPPAWQEFLDFFGRPITLEPSPPRDWARGVPRPGPVTPVMGVRPGPEVLHPQSGEGLGLVHPTMDRQEAGPRAVTRQTT